jgi:hypothetical protein
MHKPVLLQEVIDALRPRAGGDYIDATVGAGGHTAAILTASAPDGRVYGFDRDREALDVSRIQLDAFGDRVHLLHANFDQLAIMASRYHLPRVDGLLLDLGVSSMQLDRPGRGFSFQLEGPIDMRMDPIVGQPAGNLLPRWSTSYPKKRWLTSSILMAKSPTVDELPGLLSGFDHFNERLIWPKLWPRLCRPGQAAGAGEKAKKRFIPLPVPSRPFASQSMMNWERWNESCRKLWTS